MKSTRIANDQLLSSLLLSVLHFLERSGLSRRQIKVAFDKSMEELANADSRQSWIKIASPRPGDETVESGVLRMWHRHPKYLNSDAQPVAIRLYGRAPSVESLVRMQKTGSDPRRTIIALKNVGLIRRLPSGRYVPLQDAAMVGKLHSLSVGHAGKAVMRLLGTVLRNTSGKRVRLIERTARVPDLDAKEAKAFADFTRKQGLAYLQSVDDWLETRRKNAKPKNGKPRRNTTGAGVHLFAYIGDEVDDVLTPPPATPGEVSFRHLSLGVPYGSRRAAVPCTTSGVPA